MTTEERQNWLYLKSSCGRILLTDDPVLMRLLVKTQRQANECLKKDVKKLYPGYCITYETLCKCDCHKLSENGGWHSLECCPDCGASLIGGVFD